MRDIAIVSYAQTPYVRSEVLRNEVEMLMPVIDAAVNALVGAEHGTGFDVDERTGSPTPLG